MFKFELNQKVKDIVTGFKGVIMARVEYNTGCIQYGIQKEGLNKDGNMESYVYLDECRLKAIVGILNIKKGKEGPCQHPTGNM